MTQEKSIRVVIRQPLHALLDKWSNILGVDDYGEVVNYLLLSLNRSDSNNSATEAQVLEQLLTKMRDNNNELKNQLETHKREVDNILNSLIDDFS